MKRKKVTVSGISGRDRILEYIKGHYENFCEGFSRGIDHAHLSLDGFTKTEIKAAKKCAKAIGLNSRVNAAAHELLLYPPGRNVENHAHTREEIEDKSNKVLLSLNK
jgi:hypothetical protein